MSGRHHRGHDDSPHNHHKRRRSRSRSRTRDRSHRDGSKERSKSKSKRDSDSHQTSKSHHKRSRSRSSDTASSSEAHEKHHKHKKHKHKKSSKKKHKKSKKLKKKIKAAKAVLANAEKAEQKGLEFITLDDYYKKATEFRLFLSEKNKFIDELPEEEAKAQFMKFAKKWNAGELPNHYYKGVSSLQLSSGALTRHRWKFKMSAQEKFKVQSVRDSIDTATSKTYEEKFGKQRKREEPTGLPPGARGPQPPSGPAGQAAAEEARELARHQLRKDRKTVRDEHNLVLDELVPKETGREAMLEKKRAKAEYTRRDKGAGDMMEYSDADLLGSDTKSDFQRMVHARQARQQKRYSAKAERVNELRQKEADRMAQFKKAMGLS